MENINKKIFNLAIPNILSNLSVPLLSSVDTAIVGHLEKVSYLGAIAIGAMIFNFIYWGFGFLRMGTTGLTAQALGSKDEKRTIMNLVRALSVAMVGAAGLIILQYPIEQLSFYLVNASDEVEFYASQYFYIRIYAAPATLALYAFHGWFLGMQNARIPLILAVVVNILNIIFNIIFIYQFDMKTDGVALGTVCAQYCGLILAVILYLKKYKRYNFFIVLKEIFEKAQLKEFFTVNTDIFIRTLSLVFVFTYFTAKSAEFGENILAANSILLQLWMILSYGIDGFAFAAESLVGKYVGEKNLFVMKNIIKKIFVLSLLLAVIYTIGFYLFDEYLLYVFTDKNEVVILALSYFGWTFAAPLINTFCYIWDGVFIGATATKPMRNTMVVSALVFFLPTYLLFKPGIGNHALWLALCLFMIVRGISLSIYAQRVIFKKILP